MCQAGPPPLARLPFSSSLYQQRYLRQYGYTNLTEFPALLRAGVGAGLSLAELLGNL